MTWSIETSRGRESAKIAPIAARYLQGVFLDIGCGTEKVWPSAIGVDNGHHFGRGAADIQCDATKLTLFADNSVDAVFSSHVLEHFPRDKVADILREWSRVIRIGGYLVLYVPSALSYPKCGEDGANPDHKWDIYPGDIETYFAGTYENQWTMLEGEERYDGDEYSLYYVFRKDKTASNIQPLVDARWQRNPDGKKRCLLIRYGAIGDILQSSSVFSGIKRQGYHLTVNCTDSAYEVIKHDPNVDDFILQAKDYVPNTELGPYTQKLATRFDKVINHCESIEGSLLQIPGRVQHGYSHDVREKLYGQTNYVEHLHRISGTPFDAKVKFYATEQETQMAKCVVDVGSPTIMFVLHGTSYHKIYPWTQILVAWILNKTPMSVILIGDGKDGFMIQEALREYAEKQLSEDAQERIHYACGKYNIRSALAIAQQVDCVVGPETGILNAVSHEPMPKVVWLSHSSRVNLTRDWVNTSALIPNNKCACYPCHQLHYTWEFCCKSTETNAALCASEISPEDTYRAIMHRLEPWFRKSKKWTGLHSQATKQLQVPSRSGLTIAASKAQLQL